MFLSVAHNHFVDRIVDNGIKIQIEQDTNECTICASHFKMSADSDFETNPLTLHYVNSQESTEPAAELPIVGIYNERAPPSIIRS